MVALRQVVCSCNFEIPVSSETGIFQLVKEVCHCEEGVARRGNPYSKMLPFWS